MHPKNWGSGSLRHGVLVSIGPWTVDMDPEKKVLCIQDDSSPYNGMPVHRFRSDVTNPMSQENVLRHKKEEQAALAENRSRKHVPYPQPPTYDAKNDNIEYPGDYDPSIIRKLKLNAE